MTNSFNDIPHLEKSDFNDNNKFIHSKMPILVMFYRDGCGYCEQIKPVYTALSTMVPCAVIDTSSQRDLAQPIMREFDIQGVPSILLLKNFSFTLVYKGDRSLEDLKSFYDANKN